MRGRISERAKARNGRVELAVPWHRANEPSLRGIVARSFKPGQKILDHEVDE
jgi:hypothetical protein